MARPLDIHTRPLDIHTRPLDTRKQENGRPHAAGEPAEGHPSAQEETGSPLATVLYADPDPDLGDLVRYALARDGCEVLLTQRGADALRLLRTGRIDLALLDVTLPGLSGLEVLARLRTVSSLPVVLLGTRAAEEDMLAGFARGADDYVPKPFSVPVLRQRLKAILRRVQAQQVAPVLEGARTYRVQGAHFRAEYHEVVSAGVRVTLTATESRILELLCQHAGQALPAARIMAGVWGWDSRSDVTVVKTHIRHLRAKFGRLPHRPDPIQTRAGVGYRVLPPADAPAEEQGPRLALPA